MGGLRVLALLGALAAAGCGSQPFEVAQPGEMRRGEAGLFSGPDGVFTVLGDPPPPPETRAPSPPNL